MLKKVALSLVTAAVLMVAMLAGLSAVSKTDLAVPGVEMPAGYSYAESTSVAEGK